MKDDFLEFSAPQQLEEYHDLAYTSFLDTRFLLTHLLKMLGVQITCLHIHVQMLVSQSARTYAARFTQKSNSH